VSRRQIDSNGRELTMGTTSAAGTGNYLAIPTFITLRGILQQHIRLRGELLLIGNKSKIHLTFQEVAFF
jgi:hypothetical protein